MSESINNKIQFISDDWENGRIIIPDEIIKLFKSSKTNKITVTLSKSYSDILSESDIDKKVFDKIRDIQHLPEEVVLNFLATEGAFVRSDFVLRVKNGQK